MNARYARQLSAAQSAYDNAHDAEYDRMEAEAAAAEERTEAILSDPKAVRTILDDLTGDMDGQWYTDLFVALNGLHDYDASKLSGSSVLAALYRAGREVHAALVARIERDA